VTISENILVEDSLRASPAGFEVQVLLNWYRSLPLSCVQTLELTVDGQPVPRAQIRFLINGRDRSLDELHDLVDEDWYVQDKATLRVQRSPATKAGDPLDIALKLGSRIPYIVTGPSSALEQVSTLQRQMVAR
jgi:hypothetical protein